MNLVHPRDLIGIGEAHMVPAFEIGADDLLLRIDLWEPDAR